MSEVFNPYDVNILMLVLENVQETGNTIDLLEKDAFISLSLYEDMFAPSLSGRILLKDVIDWGSALPLVGEEILWMDIESTDTQGSDRVVQVPPMFVYNIQPLDSEDFVHGRQWALDFASYTHAVGNFDESHLTGLLSEESGQDEQTEKYFMGPIHELAQKIMDNNNAFTEGWGNDHEPLVEETGNQIYYKPNQGSYSVIRKDTEQTPLELLTQLAENSIDKENPNAVSFVFYQDLDRWNFRSIDKMVQEEPVKQITAGMADGEGYNQKDRILNHTVVRQANNFDNSRNGFFASTMKYYIPKPDVNRYPSWFSGNTETYYYKVNCRYKDHFPAAIIGFEQIEYGKAEWRYAFAEVYLVFDYSERKPFFKIKPIEHGGIRSWVTFKEEGPHWINGGDAGNYNLFGRPAFNTMESGNDGYLDYQVRTGWEAPGIRMDTEIWEKSCMKIQPIRGSFMGGDHTVIDVDKNNVSRFVPDGSNYQVPDDGDDAYGKFPIVDMKIYYDQDGEPQFFFTAENTVDGECRDSESEYSCQDPEV